VRVGQKIEDGVRMLCRKCEVMVATPQGAAAPSLPSPSLHW
jgi:hypothetical protein